MQYLIYLITIGGMGFGILIPELNVAKPAIPYLIGLLLAVNFYEIEFKWKRFLRWELVITLSLSALIIPPIYYLLLSKGLLPEYRIGLLLTAVAPSGVMPLVLGRYIPKIDNDLILGNFLVTTFGSILYLPAVVRWLAGETINVPASQLLIKTALMILLPYGASLIMKSSLLTNFVDRIKASFKPIFLGLLFIICAVATSGASHQIQWNTGMVRLVILVFSVYLVQGGVAYLAGSLFWDQPIRRTLTLISSSRNNQITLGIAVINFAPATAIPCILGFIFHHVANAIWLYLFRK